MLNLKGRRPVRGPDFNSKTHGHLGSQSTLCQKAFPSELEFRPAQGL